MTYTPPNSLCTRNKVQFYQSSQWCYSAQLLSDVAEDNASRHQSWKRKRQKWFCPSMWKKGMLWATHLYLSRSFSTTERTTGFLSTESSKGERAFVKNLQSCPERNMGLIIIYPPHILYMYTHDKRIYLWCEGAGWPPPSGGTAGGGWCLCWAECCLWSTRWTPDQWRKHYIAFWIMSSDGWDP